MGNTRDHKSILILHVVLSLAAVAVLFARRQNRMWTSLSAGAAASC